VGEAAPEPPGSWPTKLLTCITPRPPPPVMLREAASPRPAAPFGCAHEGETACGAPHTCPPEGHTCPVPQVLGRDDVARSANAVPGGAGVAKLEAVRRQARPERRGGKNRGRSVKARAPALEVTADPDRCSTSRPKGDSR